MKVFFYNYRVFEYKNECDVYSLSTYCWNILISFHGRIPVDQRENNINENDQKLDWRDIFIKLSKDINDT